MRPLPVIVALCFLMLPLGILAQKPCSNIAEYPIRFAILGDRTGSHQEGVYEEIVEEIARMRPDFVMTVGDMIEGYTSDTIQMRTEWDEYFSIMEPLTMPVYYTPGNHDITSDIMEPVFRGRVGKPYYSFEHRDMHFVILDNSRWESTEELPTDQIEWLKQDLAANRSACFTFVFFHKPFWYRTIADGNPDQLHEIFKAYGVDAVFTGHFHTYFSGEFDGILYTSLGSSGGETEESPPGVMYQFGWVTIDGQGIHIAPVKKDAVLPWTVQSVSEMRASNLLKSNGVSFVSPFSVGESVNTSASELTVSLKHPVAELRYEDTLRWHIPEGWLIEPADYAFTLSGDSPANVSFKVIASENVYPLPTLSTRLPYSQGKFASITKSLEVARTAACNSVSGKISIDGILSEESWRQPVSRLLANDGMASRQDSTAFFFAYDSENLFMAVYCRESRPDSLRATMTRRDEAVYTEDAVGIMFRSSSTDKTAYQVYINPLGTIYDQKLEKQSDGYWLGMQDWNGDYEVETSRESDHYIVEIRIPLAQFGTSAGPDDQWRVNFRRKQARLNSAAAFQVPWSYDPASFGHLRFD